MTKIYFVRHGETHWNTQGILQGKLNSSLTDEGIEQGKLVGEKLSDIDIKKIYTSPQGRAYDTAALIKSEKDIEIIKVDEIMEIGFGSVEGLEKEVFKENYPRAFKNFWSNPTIYNPKEFGGETFNEVKNRAIAGLKKIVSENEHGEIVVVSHGITLKVLFGYMMGHSLEEFWLDPVPQNTSITTVIYKNEKFEIEDFSNTNHLKANKEWDSSKYK